MAIRKNNLIVLKGRLEKEGLTFYQRGGITVIRQAGSKQPHRRTRGQFEARQRMANCTSLWKALRLATEPVLAGGKSSYGRFCTLMRKLPVTYLTKDERLRGAKLLLPGMPVSDGMLPDIEYWLGDVEGLPALLTSLRLKEGARSMAAALYGRGAELKSNERLCLYRLEQTAKVENGELTPRLTVKVEVLDYDSCQNGQPFSDIELRNVDGHLALVGDVLGDEMRGWALVRMNGDKASSQKVETHCNLYEQYLTEEAFERAAKSYGGLTDEPYLTPNEN